MPNPNLRFKNARKKVPFGFTDNQRRIDTKDKIFNGKRYFSVFGSGSKSQVDELAKRVKDEGYSVRIVKSKVGKRTFYDLYSRKG